jgi:hypothetical protein
MQERNGQPQNQPTPTPNDGTPQNDPAAALHWAAIAHGLAEARTLQGNPLTPVERAEYNRYQNAAHAHGYTDTEIRAHRAKLEQAPTR